MTRLMGPDERRPPFAEERCPISNLTQTHPGSQDPFGDIPALIRTRTSGLFQPRRDVGTFLSIELDVSRLNELHKHLWLAGLPTGARALHRQKLMDREIVLTEQADLHLVWYQNRIFIKPLPTFLLRQSMWRDHLCRSQDLYANACGFLLSYAWLVCYRTDFRIAQELGLVPFSVEWESWTTFMADVLSHVAPSASEIVNERYHYGELRLSRLNWIYRFSTKRFNLRNFIRGYHQGPSWYSLFLKRNFGWLVVAFAYIAIVLSAMQVGLATDRLGKSSSFQKASYGFAIFSMIMPVFGVLFILIASLAISLYYVHATLEYGNKLRERLDNPPSPED
ncbi:MAG: hypothetical protein M1830_006334 [Pleopsidium flavum]|nr:MAG: hypothetical protein M1830_006334 [Pleopsidium flavum]